MTTTTALGLYSGGLDSLLSCRVIMAQGIRVVALKFVTPFFDHHILARETAYKVEVKEKYGIDVEVIDLSKGYLNLLHNPAHGFGKHFNPCIDCKILMLSHARDLMPSYGASFLVTGEVLGQRPMSQRRDTLRVIERESGCSDLLLRPLCAKRLPPTLAEREGIVDREQLYGFTGRGRKSQIRLAKEFGISDYPNPAGGCMLTDPNLGLRIEHFYNGLFSFGSEGFTVADVNLLLVGRQFKLDDDNWFVLGRDEKENERIRQLQKPEDWLFIMPDRPGPTGLLRCTGRAIKGMREEEIIRLLGGLVVRFGKKIDGQRPPAEVHVSVAGETTVKTIAPLEDEVFRHWQF